MTRQEPRSLDEELLNLIANQVKLSPYNMIFAMAIVAAMIINHIPDQPLLWGSWVLMVVVSQFYRAHRLPKLPLERQRPIEQRSREAVRINLVCALVLALSFLAFPIFTPFEAALQTMLFIAMGVGTIVVVLGWPPYVFAHVWLSLVPLFALWAWSGLAGPAKGYGLALSAIGFSYSYSMWQYGKRLYAMNEDFFANRSALADALIAAEQSDAAKTRFLAAASHDLRQPIHSLSLLTAALRRQPMDDRAQSITSSIGEAVDALSTQLDALLDISKLEAGIVPVNTTTVDLSPLLQRLAMEMREDAAMLNVFILVDCPPDTFVSTDAALLESILRNLVTNAIKHNTDCEVRLSAVPAEHHCRLTVADTGSGIAQAEQAEVFEEFYQVSNPERDRSKGLGLGLSIVKRLARLLQLDMEFDSMPGHGTSFAFTLRRVSGEEIEQRGAAITPAEADLSGLAVIVLDDEKSVREAMQQLLEMLGCRVLLADTLATAVGLARNGQVDIALVDYRLPGNENGLQAVRQLRELQPDMPAIIISGDTAPDRLQEVANAGLPLLSKPLGEKALRQCIASELGARSTD
jgi:signal transduction histidine kinase